MIKNFIYLNEPKLYSFSSQLFDGITEYVLDEQLLEHTNHDEQKGKLASGRIIANVIKETSTSKVKKFLHDHSFNLFEKELLSSNSLLDINGEGLSFKEICDSSKSFIRIQSQGKFVDLEEIKNLFINFGKISEAITVLPLIEEMQKLELEKCTNPNKNELKNKQSALDKAINIKSAEIAAGMPKRAVNAFETVIENFGDDIIRFQQEIGEIIFSTCLSKEYLREPLESIYRKYSRKTAKKFTVLGFISHADGTPEPNIKTIGEGKSMLQHMSGLAENMYEIEQIFSKKLDNEIIIEPIAIYTEL